jgi:hypothetical protein
MFNPGMVGQLSGGIPGTIGQQVLPQVQPQQQNQQQPKQQPASEPQDGPGSKSVGMPNMGPGGPQPFKGAAPNYTFHGAEDSIQALISNAHIGVVLMGAACLVGGCIGMALAGPKETQKDESDSEEE